MTVIEAARQLEVSARTVRQLCLTGRLAHVRLGLGKGIIRIGQVDIDAFRAACRVEAEGTRPPKPPKRYAAAERAALVAEQVAFEAKHQAEKDARRRAREAVAARDHFPPSCWRLDIERWKSQ